MVYVLFIMYGGIKSWIIFSLLWFCVKVKRWCVKYVGYLYVKCVLFVCFVK